MPYDVEKRGKEWVVRHGKKIFGVHSSKAKAREQQKAIYANEKKGK